MRFLAVITLLILVMAQPVAAQTFKPDFWAGNEAWNKNDYATALKHFRPLAEKGDARAQTKLGWMYYRGMVVTKDYKKAVKWYRKAAKQVHADAQSVLALMSRVG